MSKQTSLVILLGLFLVGFAGAVWAQDTTTVTNVTNPCINSTFKSYSPNMTTPVAILIDRRVTFNPVTFCTTAAMNSASCNREPTLLVAAASGSQITMSPSCSWNCGACGTIVTDASIGLPVELMDFEVDDEGDE